MKGTRYVDGVLTTQEHLNNTDQRKSEAIKERFGSLTSYGIVSDGGNPLALTYVDSTHFSVTQGEAYCAFDKTNTSPGHGNTGERIYAPSSLTNHLIKNTGEDNHIFVVYVETHKDRQLDEASIAHYTSKVDSFVIAQLTASGLSSLDSGGTVYIANNPVHANQTDFYSLSNDELDDTFGVGKWTLNGSVLEVGLNVTDHNSVYLGTFNFSGARIDVETGARIIPTFYIDDNALNLDNIEQVAQGNHRLNQHSNGIIGAATALECTVDATGSPDELNITSLGGTDYAYMGGRKLDSTSIISTQLNIIANPTNFPTDGADYYIYYYYNVSAGTFQTVSGVVGSTTVTGGASVNDNYMILCKVYVDTSAGTIESYSGDNRYASGSGSSPVTDLRIFGTLQTNNISDDTLGEMGGHNLLPNGEFEEGFAGQAPVGWFGNGILNAATSIGGRYSLELGSSEIALSRAIPYNRLNIYNLEASAKAAGGTGTYEVGLRGYVGKEWGDTDISNDATAPFNIAYKAAISAATKVASGAMETADFSSSDWAWTTPAGGSYTAADLDKIKYIKAYVKNISGSTIYIDNVKLADKQGITATTTEINTICDGITATAVEANQALDGISVDVTDVNLNTLTAGAATDASSLHSHTTANLNDTTATGGNLNTLTGGGSTSLHSHPGGVTNGDSHNHSGGDGATIGTDGVNQNSIANNSVGQNELRTTLPGAVSTTLVHAQLTLPGGSYGFYPQISMSVTSSAYHLASLLSPRDADGNLHSDAGFTSYTSILTLGAAGGITMYAKQRYISASPPYKVGARTWGHFLYLLVNSTGDVLSSYEAEDPPYAYNGPDHNAKDSIDRIHAVPHPFVDYWERDPATDGLEIILVDLRDTDMPAWRADILPQGKGIIEDLGGINKKGKIITPASLGMPNIPGHSNIVKVRARI